MAKNDKEFFLSPHLCNHYLNLYYNQYICVQHVLSFLEFHASSYGFVNNFSWWFTLYIVFQLHEESHMLKFCIILVCEVRGLNLDCILEVIWNEPSLLMGNSCCYYNALKVFLMYPYNYLEIYVKWFNQSIEKSFLLVLSNDTFNMGILSDTQYLFWLSCKESDILFKHRNLTFFLQWAHSKINIDALYVKLSVMF